MLKKMLPLFLVLFVWAASPALAQGGRHSAEGNFQYPPTAENTSAYSQPMAEPMCYRGLNGRGKVITWAKSKEQCLHESTGQSWGHSGHYENFTRTHQAWR